MRGAPMLEGPIISSGSYEDAKVGNAGATGTALPRGRRPAFDREAAVAVARQLFHERGYDAVSIADLTRALNINPPSLYAAYGSKLGLFELAIQSYAEEDRQRVLNDLQPTSPPAAALGELIVRTARRYSADPARPGCMIATALQADTAEAREIAVRVARANEALLLEFVKPHTKPAEARTIVHFVMQNLRGLSLNARLGYRPADLLAGARLAGRAVAGLFRPV